MQRPLGILVLFACTAAAASAIPARPLYLPDPPPKAPAYRPAFFNLNNTAWLGKYNNIARIFIFEANGTVSYRSPTSPTVFKNRGSWRVIGTTIMFEQNIGKNVVMEFRGSVHNPSTIVGESVTKAGLKTTQTLQRTNLK